ncbi:hypothetical protein BT96DRAFT_943335 [Gymnopus androsaceus JB14]|uniref:Uncharacterized protein n=1 Tax=Gymnopus androsaceus JB14 TaxID=1447944 RepID=A0A6A4HAB6_9AGAR|nr:hypothetical protein BT96DRAFT_943335 [Gymnopus androsaceus JB14]
MISAEDILIIAPIEILVSKNTIIPVNKHEEIVTVLSIPSNVYNFPSPSQTIGSFIVTGSKKHPHTKPWNMSMFVEDQPQVAWATWVTRATQVNGDYPLGYPEVTP